MDKAKTLGTTVMTLGFASVAFGFVKMLLGDYTGLSYMASSGFFLYAAKAVYSYCNGRDEAKKEAKNGLEKELE